MFLSNLVNTTGEFILSTEVKAWAEQRVAEGATDLSVADAIGSFYSEFYFWVNLAGVVVQFFLVSRIIRYIGVAGAILVLPVIALGSYAAFALIPTLVVLRIAKTAENTTDYSLNNTVRNALFLPLTTEEKYKAKQAVDTFFVRGGDVASAGVVALGLHVLSWESRGFALLNLGVVGVWLVVGIAIGTIYKKEGGDEEEPDQR
jgi:AAA family ATP:ADP antiporter